MTHEFEQAAYSSICVLQPDQRELNETDTTRLVAESVSEIIRADEGGKPIKPKTLIDTVNRKAGEFFRQEKTKRLMVTSLSVDGFDGFPIDVIGSKIDRADRETFAFPEELFQSSSFVTEHIKNSKYDVISVETNQITINQAFDEAMSAVNLLRGVWSLSATFASSSPRHWSKVPRRRWIGVIHASPVHTLHNEDGSLVRETYWYEPDYAEDGKLFKPRQGWEKLEKSRRQVFALIDASPFRNDLVDILCRTPLRLNKQTSMWHS